MSTTRTAPPLAVPTINLASLMYGLDDYLRERGADPDAILGRAGLAPGDLTDPERRIPLIRFLRLLEFCADALGDPHFGLRFGTQYDPRHAGVVGNVALASSTVRRALQTIGRYLPTMVDSAVYRLEVEGGTAFSYSYYVDPLMMTYQQKNDWGVAFICNVIRHGLGEPDWAPAEVVLPQLVAESAAARRERMGLLRAKVRIGHAWAGIRFDAAVLERSMTTADATVERLMRHYGDLQLAGLQTQGDPVTRLRRSIAQLVIEGDNSVERLAQSLGCSVRTLQRRLAARGLNYSDLLAEVRKTLALNLLENPRLGIAQIAYCLGYSEVSTFNHAFRRWVGQPPRDYRNSRKSSPRSHSSWD
ncbi:MAG TPA: AraC family transcriptional regulator [Steroidobacteraceae bacterium]|nr:AraC family transcriptional regulator [Steroidobacteraceae bacterium]